MKLLQNIIKSLSKEEIRFYKLFVGRTKQSKKRKDLVLFDIIKNSSDENFSKKAIDLLDITSNNYYQLKNRIYNDLNNSIVWQHISKDYQSKSFSFVLLSRVYKNKGELNLAYHYLQNAEKEAKKNELYEILSIVYSEIIELSHELISIDLDYYLNLIKKNRIIVQEVEEIETWLAKLMYDIKTKQNFAKSDPTLINVLNNYYKKNAKKKIVLESPRFRFRLFKMYSRLLLQQEDYNNLKKFLVHSYNDLQKDKLFNRSNHNDKLTLLTYLTNCFYKIKEYSKSLEYADELYNAMSEFDGFLKEKYIFYYYNSLVLNYSVKDKTKALAIIEKAKKNETIKKLPAYTSFVYLNTTLIYYHQKKYPLAVRNISRLIQQKDFLSLDIILQLKIYIAELIIRLKLNQDDKIKEQIDFVKSEYKKPLAENNNKRDAVAIELISMIVHKKDIRKFIASISSTIQNNKTINSDIISYNDWIETLATEY